MKMTAITGCAKSDEACIELAVQTLYVAADLRAAANCDTPFGRQMAQAATLLENLALRELESREL